MTTTMRTDHAALFAVLSSLADNKQAIGRRYAFWCNGAPTLEAAVAAAAMTQDELGHARTLYPLLANFTQAQADLAQVEPETRTLNYALSFLDHDFAGWSDFVATNFLLDTALTTFFAGAQRSTYEPLGARARKILLEERIHAAHADGWVRRLMKAGGAVRATMSASLLGLWEETLCWFGPEDDPAMQRLYEEGIIDATPDTLRARFLHTIMPTLQAVDFEVPVAFDSENKTWRVTQALPWERWDVAARCLRPQGQGAQ
ncbi:phenylacetate-CoA oxygenase subunit PaaI [Ktedonobacter sp. SOSP1-85]|uniref:1,2-phenylacetyl-CoA epoxidase subunit PaaC n=1 Tax=Ktedonobacter sp. SOSP1-85 TaxID=2778367 RepID=UPI0019160AA5|nr:Phenylacetic acid catabolic protein [Ktedonobacter sp. SOSP1-85]GHO74533.1 phenylacetate-CoA oxygenase subunit PaaI [Ktedonobacter sp. SOSP1-85]